MYRLHIIVLHPPSGPCNAVELLAGLNHEHLFWREFLVCFLFLDFFFESRKEVGAGWHPYGNKEKEQEHMGTAPVPQCSRNTFPGHQGKTHRG